MVPSFENILLLYVLVKSFDCEADEYGDELDRYHQPLYTKALAILDVIHDSRSESRRHPDRLSNMNRTRTT